MAKFTRLSAESLNHQEPGALVSRFVGDVDTVETLFTSGIVSMFADACKIVSILAVVWFANRGLTLVLAALLPLLRGSCALIPIIATTHVCGGIMNALGLQGASLKISLASGLLGVLTVQFLVPVIGLWGAAVSLGAVQGLTLLLSLLVLRRSGCIARSR